jgi:hypothetical protein
VGDEQQGNESDQAGSSDEGSPPDESDGTQADTFMDTHGNSRLTTEEYRNDQRFGRRVVIKRGRQNRG